MRNGNESSLLAIVLPPVAAAAAVQDAWAIGDAVAVVDPRDPQFRIEERLGALRPTEILDAQGRRAWRDRDGEGEPVPAGVAAVVATSGTTAEPRWVMLEEHALEASAFAVHAALGAPFVLTTVLATLQGFNHNLVRASLSLGAGPVQTFFRVTLPVIAPGVISGALFAFATSFDEVVVTLFKIGRAHV